MRSANLLPLFLALAACGGGSGDESNSLEAELAGAEDANGVDPEIMAALNDPIMVDPQLSVKSNADAIRPPPQAYSAALPHPSSAVGSPIKGDDNPKPGPSPTATTDPVARRAITLGALAGGQCASRLAYSAIWATRLPAGLTLHPDARVIEAAGVQDGECSLRAVSFHLSRGATHLVDWVDARATASGYSSQRLADGSLLILKGSKSNGARYLLYATDTADGGANVDMIVEGG